MRRQARGVNAGGTNAGRGSAGRRCRLSSGLDREQAEEYSRMDWTRSRLRSIQDGLLWGATATTKVGRRNAGRGSALGCAADHPMDWTGSRLRSIHYSRMDWTGSRLWSIQDGLL